MAKYLNAENFEGCDVFLTNMDNDLWVGVCYDDNFGCAYVNARQLYEELKEYFENNKSELTKGDD